MKGVLNLYKPKGITSSSAVVACRKILGTKAIGHMGTLDPAGEGVLLLGVGKATRLFDYFLTKDKIYEAEFCFGYTTDTLDGEGIVLDKTEQVPTVSQIQAALPQFVGVLQQIPPQYSAKSVGGVRAYKLARIGKTAELKPSRVEVKSLRWLAETDINTHLIRIHCSAGTYIRSLCRDVSQSLGTLGTMVSIKRVQCGNFSIQDSITLDRLKEIGSSALTSVEESIASLPKLTLSDMQYTPLCNGIKIPITEEKYRNSDFALYCKGELFGIAHLVDDYIKVKTYLRD